MSTSDQDRRVAERTTELGAARATVVPVGPAGVGAVVAVYTDRDRCELGYERILPDGTVTSADPWAATVAAELRGAHA
jgi:hypothetical protein